MAGLQSYLAFTKTVRCGNFAAAAREMGMSASAVAKSIALLEADLGIRLFHRTTRQVTLTSDGHELYERCKRITDEIEALRDDAAGARNEPSGTLRTDVPVVVGRQLVVPVLAELARRYPPLAFEVRFSDHYVDLVKEVLDVAVRVGPLADSTLVGRRIGEQQLVIAASPDYLQRCGAPSKPADLETHTCLPFHIPTTGIARPWQLRNGRKNLELKPQSSIAMNDGEAVLAAAEAGMGLVQVPDCIAAEALRGCRLIEALTRAR